MTTMEALAMFVLGAAAGGYAVAVVVRWPAEMQRVRRAVAEWDGPTSEREMPPPPSPIPCRHHVHVTFHASPDVGANHGE